MTAPVAIAMIFLGGFVAIPAFGRWSHQITEGLAFLLATVVLVMAILILCNRWPDYYANPRVPVVMTAEPLAD